MSAGMKQEPETLEEIIREIHSEGFSAGLHGNCSVRTGYFDCMASRIQQACNARVKEMEKKISELEDELLSAQEYGQQWRDRCFEGNED